MVDLGLLLLRHCRPVTALLLMLGRPVTALVLLGRLVADLRLMLSRPVSVLRWRNDTGHPNFIQNPFLFGQFGKFDFVLAVKSGGLEIPGVI